MRKNNVSHKNLYNVSHVHQSQAGVYDRHFLSICFGTVPLNISPKYVPLTIFFPVSHNVKNVPKTPDSRMDG